MGTEKDIKKQIVWQDIKPSQPQLKLVSKTATKKLKISPKKIIAIFILIIFVIVLLTYFLATSQSTQKTNISGDIQTTNITPTLLKGTPEYSTILPNNKKIDDLGGWTRVSPANTDPVFAYADKIENVSINVSEQMLPNDFKTDTENKIEKLSQGFKASEKITIGSTIVHIGTSANGPQSIIFSLNGLLILIKSDTKISNNEWAKYINFMQ